LLITEKIFIRIFREFVQPIIQHASLPYQKSVKGLVKDLPEMAEIHKLTYPALVIIGQVVGIGATD